MSRVPLWISLQNFVEISRTVVEILRFHDFQNESRPPCLCFQIKISDGRKQSWQTHSVASSEISSRSVKSLQKYGDLSLFFKMAAGYHLDLLDTYLDHHIKYCAKFGWNRCSSFENIKVFFSILCAVWFKDSYPSPQNCRFWGMIPLKWEALSWLIADTDSL